MRILSAREKTLRKQGKSLVTSLRDVVHPCVLIQSPESTLVSFITVHCGFLDKIFQ